MPNDHPVRNTYTVSQLNQAIRRLLEGGFPPLWVAGEMSNLARPASGHLYFSLKDADAQVRCAFFRNRAMLLRQRPENGQQVLVRARIGFYAPRGECQLIVEHLEPAGDGALRRAYDALRLRLEREGLFAAEHKRPLPAFPRRIGVITSPSGAAIRDVTTILARRFPGLPVLIYPTQVQGTEAGHRVADAIELASQRGECDVLLLVRGGGSLEDLWAFNEERVARAIHACPIPIVSGIGHESDVTIADFVADLRAPTPSAAAELASPDRAKWLHQIERLQHRLSGATTRYVQGRRQRLDWLEQRLIRQYPGRRLQDRAQRLDDLEQRLAQAMAVRLERLRANASGLQIRLSGQIPKGRLQRAEERCHHLGLRLATLMGQRLERDRYRLAQLSRALQAVSPLQTLSRGYAVVRRHPEGEIIRRADQVDAGESVETLLGEGSLICRVHEVRRH